MAFQASVTEENHDGSGHFYKIVVMSEGQTWEVERKYREFLELDGKLKQEAPHINRGVLPGPGLTGWKDSVQSSFSKLSVMFNGNNKDLSTAKLAELFDLKGQRRQALDAYLQTLVQQVNSLDDVPVMKKFLTPYGVVGWSYVDSKQASLRPTVPTKSPQTAGYRMQHLLGEGSQGQVFQASDWKGKSWAVKVCPKQQVSEDKVMTMASEVDLMKKVDSKYVAKVADIFQDASSFYVVSELYAGGDFRDLTSRAEDAGVSMTESWWRDLFRQCYVGLYHLHNSALVHCDIKEGNLMLKHSNLAKPEVVIVDFGLAQMNVGASSSLAGTPGYIPPETWQTGKWFAEGDVFSMAVVMVQMLGDAVPISPSFGEVRFGVFTSGVQTNEEIRHATATRDLTEITQILPPDWVHFKALIPKVSEKDLMKRLRVLQVLDQPWFSLPALSGLEHNPLLAKRQRLGQASSSEPQQPVQYPAQQPSYQLVQTTNGPVYYTTPASSQQQQPAVQPMGTLSQQQIPQIGSFAQPAQMGSFTQPAQMGSFTQPAQPASSASQQQAQPMQQQVQPVGTLSQQQLPQMGSFAQPMGNVTQQPQAQQPLGGYSQQQVQPVGTMSRSAMQLGVYPQTQSFASQQQAGGAAVQSGSHTQQMLYSVNAGSGSAIQYGLPCGVAAQAQTYFSTPQHVVR